MKHVNLVALGSVAVWLAGCASASKVVVQESVGPCHKVALAGASDGSLQVYSARERGPIDANTEAYIWNNDFGKNEFLYGTGRSDYRIIGPDGKVLEKVRNSPGSNDGQPAVVMLRPGLYTVEADAEDSGGITTTVVVPVVVEAGQLTTVHLEPTWQRSGGAVHSSGPVRLADGRIIGCRADRLLSQHLQSVAPVGPGTGLAGKP